MKTIGYFKYSNFRILLPFIRITAGLIDFKFHNKRLLLYVQGLKIEIIKFEREENIAKKESALQMLLFRILILIFGKYFLLQINNTIFMYQFIVLKEEMILSNFEINPETAEILMQIKAVCTRLHLYDESLVSIAPITFKISLPGYISLLRAFQKGNCEITVGEIYGNLEIKNFHDIALIPKQEKTENKQIVLPRDIGLIVHSIKLNVHGLELSSMALKLDINTKTEITSEFNINEIALKSANLDLLHMSKIYASICKISEILEIVIKINHPILNMCPTLAEFIMNCIPPQSLNLVDDPTHRRHLNLKINSNVIIVNLLDKANLHPVILGKLENLHVNFSQTDLLDFQICSDDFGLDAVNDYQIIYLKNPFVESNINENRFGIDSLEIELSQDTYENCCPLFLDILFIFLKTKNNFTIPSVQKSSKTWKFVLNKIKAMAKFHDGYAIEVHNRFFEAEIRGRELFFNILDSDIFSHDNGFRKVLTCPTGIVHKWYSEDNLAMVDVKGNDIVLFLPTGYHLGKGIFKGMNKITTMYKWTKNLVFPGQIIKEKP